MNPAMPVLRLLLGESKITVIYSGHCLEELYEIQLSKIRKKYNIHTDLQRPRGKSLRLNMG